MVKARCMKCKNQAEVTMFKL